MSNSTGTPPSPIQVDLVLQYMGEYPNRDAAIIALSMYLAVAVGVLGMTVKTRAWFMLTVFATGLLEAAGFVARILFMDNADRTTYIFMQCFLIISPVLLAIVEYVCVGKLLQGSEAARGTHLTKWLAPLFTLSDFLCLFLQGGGGAAVSSTSLETMEQGRKLLLAGLFLQLCFFSMFTALVIYIQRNDKFGFRGQAPLRPLFLCLYVTIALMYIRNIFRVVEFIQGFHGYLATNEVFFYVFDFVPIFFCFVFFTFLHYGRYLPPIPPAGCIKDAQLPVSQGPNQNIGQQGSQAYDRQPDSLKPLEVVKVVTPVRLNRVTNSSDSSGAAVPP